MLAMNVVVEAQGPIIGNHFLLIVAIVTHKNYLR